MRMREASRPTAALVSTRGVGSRMPRQYVQPSSATQRETQKATTENVDYGVSPVIHRPPGTYTKEPVLKLDTAQILTPTLPCLPPPAAKLHLEVRSPCGRSARGRPNVVLWPGMPRLHNKDPMVWRRVASLLWTASAILPPQQAPHAATRCGPPTSRQQSCKSPNTPTNAHRLRTKLQVRRHLERPMGAGRSADLSGIGFGRWCDVVAVGGRALIGAARPGARAARAIRNRRRRRTQQNATMRDLPPQTQTAQSNTRQHGEKSRSM